VNRGQVTVREFMERFWDSHSHEWAANTQTQYRQYAQAYVIPSVGGL
jgi:hypothetical protein